MRQLRFLYTPLLLLTFASGTAFQAHGQDVADPHAAHHHEQVSAEAHPQGSAAESDMMAQCQQMMSPRTQVLQRIEASDEKLANLLEQLNKTKCNRRIDALVKVVNELVAEQKQLREALMPAEPASMHGMHGADSGHDKAH